MRHVLNIEEGGPTLEGVFQRIAEGNTILFLGAGASVTDKKYLSREIVEYYCNKTGLCFETQDATEYVDMMSENDAFDRSDFDNDVCNYLSLLKPQEAHRSIARAPWKEIITTNLDTLIEQSFQEIRGTHEQNLKLVLARDRGSYGRNITNDEVKYVKLNGCMASPIEFPLVFSTKDFERSSQYHRFVLQSLEFLSPRIQFVSIGYSFSDPFAKRLLDRYNRYALRGKRELWMVDPGVQESLLPFHESRNIRVIKGTASEFFLKYEAWRSQADEATLKRKRFDFVSPSSAPASIPNHLKARIVDNVRQLSPRVSTHTLRQDEYYLGERPTYFVVTKDYDVVKRVNLDKLVKETEQALTEKGVFIPMLALEGQYGSGKSTTAYRIIHELTTTRQDLVAFEVLDPARIRDVDLIDLIKSINIQNVLLLFDECEADSSFKALVELQTSLSSAQISNVNVVIIAPIRENIFARLQAQRRYPGIKAIEADASFSEPEAFDLVGKLADAGVLEVRDARERRQLAKKVSYEYEGDAFVSLLDLVTNGHHSATLQDAFNQLSPKVKEAFLYTSLLYRFKLEVPASLIVNLVSKDWGEFEAEVLRLDGKGILIQEMLVSEPRNGQGTYSDLILRTRHPVISDFLIRLTLSDIDRRFKYYERLFKSLKSSLHNSRMVIDLIKALQRTREFDQAQIDSLYDSISQEFASDPHFTLHYAQNLQHRGTEEALKKGIDKIIFAEGFLRSYRRNNRLIHRRAVLNFELAKRMQERGARASSVLSAIDEARELFQIKMIEDPFSDFSFKDYLSFEIWCLKNLSSDAELQASQMIRIEDILNRAKRQLVSDEGLEAISSREADFRRVQAQIVGNTEGYISYMSNMYDNPSLRTYALLLQYYHYYRQSDHVELHRVIDELESYSHLSTVAKVLFTYYGRSCWVVQHRLRVFDLARSHEKTLSDDPLRYHYFLGVAEAYNKRFGDFFHHMNQLRRFRGSLWERDFWRDASGEIEVFNAVLFVQDGTIKAAVQDFTTDFVVARDSPKPTIEGTQEERRARVRLRFHVGGITAVVVKDT